MHRDPSDLGSRHIYFRTILKKRILGDPGASSRDDAIFSGERQFWRKSLLAPGHFFLTKRLPEVSKSVPLIGKKNIFLANQ